MIAHVKVNLFQGPSVNAAYVSRIYAGLGEKEKAIEWLEKGFEERSLGLIKVPGIRFAWTRGSTTLASPQ